MYWNCKSRSRTFALCLAILAGATCAEAQSQPPPAVVTLQQAIRYAIENYPAIHASQARVSAQQVGVELAQTAYLPRLDSTLQVNRATRNNVAGLLLPGSAIPSISGPVSDSSPAAIWSGAGALLLSWELFDFGARGATIDLARSHVARANAGADLTRLDVGISTADAFLRLAGAQETVRAARANVQRMEVFANSVSILVKNELRAGADDSRAQAELALARIQLIQAEQAEQIGRANLAQWVGIEPADLQISADPLLAQPPAPLSASGDVATHPLAAAQRATVDTSRAAQNVLGRSHVPRFSFQTAFSLRGSGATGNGTPLSGLTGLELKTSNWAGGVTATFPLFLLLARAQTDRGAKRTRRAHELRPRCSGAECPIAASPGGNGRRAPHR